MYSKWKFAVTLGPENMYILQMQAPKVKIGDRITALQQIVSPFGKVPTKALNLFNQNFFFFLFCIIFFKLTELLIFPDRYRICAIWSNWIHKISARASAGGITFIIFLLGALSIDYNSYYHYYNRKYWSQ